jgi:hypothetical protein
MNLPGGVVPGLFVSPRGGGGGGGAAPTSRTPVTFTALFVDPSNVSGVASDSNNGLTALTPIKTIAKLNSVFFLADVPAAGATVTVMSDATGADVPLDLSLTSLHGSLTFQGTPQVQLAGHTFSSVTAINPATQQREVIQGSAALNFTAFVGMLVQDLTGGNAGVSSWIAGVQESATAPNMSRPITTAFLAGVFTNGDSFQIQRGSNLTLIGSPPLVTNGAGVTFQDFTFSTTSIGMQMMGNTVFTSFNRCKFLGIFIPGGVYQHCWLDAGIQCPLFLTVLAGVYQSTFSDQSLGLTLGGDVYVGGFGVVASPPQHSYVGITGGIPGSGAQFQDTTNPNGAWVVATADPVGGPGIPAIVQGLAWGNGNTGPGISIAPGGMLTVPAGAGLRPTVTGTGGDFAFIAQNGGALLHVARPWNEVGGVYAAPAATTWANFANVASLNFNATNVATGASILGV